MITSPFSQSVQWLSRVRLSVTPRTAACRASLEPTNSSPLSQWCHPAVSSSVVPYLLGFLIYLGHLAADEIALVIWIPSLKVKHLPVLLACWVCAACVLSCFSHVRLFATVWTVSARLLCPWDSPGKNTGVGCHALLQGIFLTQGLNLCLLRILQWQADSLSLVPPEKVLYLPKVA